MTEHEERRPDEEKADEVERELDEMQERRERLGAQIGDAEEQWERHKKDERVPGATGDEDGDEGEDGEEQDDVDELDFGRSLAPEEDG